MQEHGSPPGRKKLLAGLHALGLLPIPEISNEVNREFLLASMGQVASGRWLQVLIAVDAPLVLCGAVLTYFVPTVLVVAVMFLRIHILHLVFVLVRGFADRVQDLSRGISRNVVKKMEEINSLGIIFFADGKEDLATLNRAMLYVRQNELTKRVRVVHVYKNRNDVPEHLKRNLELLDEVYPEIRIELVLARGTFDPETIREISKRYRVPQNYMFIGHPSQSFPYRLEELGGVRLIV